MNKLPEDIENKILSYIDVCQIDKTNDSYLVCQRLGLSRQTCGQLWYNQLKNHKKCYKIKAFNRLICGHHNKEIVNMIRHSLFYTY